MVCIMSCKSDIIYIKSYIDAAIYTIVGNLNSAYWQHV